MAPSKFCRRRRPTVWRDIVAPVSDSGVGRKSRPQKHAGPGLHHLYEIVVRDAAVHWRVRQSLSQREPDRLSVGETPARRVDGFSASETPRARASSVYAIGASPTPARDIKPAPGGRASQGEDEQLSGSGEFTIQGCGVTLEDYARHLAYALALADQAPPECHLLCRQC